MIYDDIYTYINTHTCLCRFSSKSHYYLVSFSHFAVGRNIVKSALMSPYSLERVFFLGVVSLLISSAITETWILHWFKLILWTVLSCAYWNKDLWTSLYLWINSLKGMKVEFWVMCWSCLIPLSFQVVMAYLLGVSVKCIILWAFHQAVRAVAIVVFLKQLWRFAEVLMNGRVAMSSEELIWPWCAVRACGGSAVWGHASMLSWGRIRLGIMASYLKLSCLSLH